MTRYIAVGSSHFRELRASDIEGVKECYFYPGICMLNNNRSEDKVRQFGRFRSIIRRCPTDGVILNLLSNDWESFLTMHNMILPVKEGVRRKWLDCNLTKKLKWSYKSTILAPEGKANIKEGLARYGNTLQEVFGQSNVLEIVQLSVLERRYAWVDGTTLDILFATWNSMLRQFCKNVVLFNARGTKIKVKFVSVEEPFLRAVQEENIFSAFTEREGINFCNRVGQRCSWGSHLVHRSLENYGEIFEIINRKLNRPLQCINN